MMTLREHAALARALIAACGGLDEAAVVNRVGRSSLGRYQDPGEPLAMPADVMLDLEVYCGRPVYSAALSGRVAEAREARAGEPLGDATASATESAAALQAMTRAALRNGVVSAAEKRALAELWAATHGAPVWRGLATVLFQASRRR